MSVRVVGPPPPLSQAAEEQYQHRVSAVRDLKAEKLEMRKVRLCGAPFVYPCVLVLFCSVTLRDHGGAGGGIELSCGL